MITKIIILISSSVLVWFGLSELTRYENAVKFSSIGCVVAFLLIVITKKAISNIEKGIEEFDDSINEELNEKDLKISKRFKSYSWLLFAISSAFALIGYFVLKEQLGLKNYLEFSANSFFLFFTIVEIFYIGLLLRVTSTFILVAAATNYEFKEEEKKKSRRKSRI